jgi:hypothetical protein
MCARTGSRRYSTSGLFGGESPWRNDRPALENWMPEHDMKIVHDWQRIGRTGLSLILGRGMSVACPSDVPPITGLSPELLTRRFVQSATEHQIREFVETFQGNDLGAQKRVIWTIMGDVGEGR